MRIYLDTSALVKRYCEEEGSELINALFESDNELITSSWTLAEAIAAIDRKVVKRQISAEERDFIIAVLLAEVAEHLTLLRFSDEFIDAIIARILAHHLSANDALHLVSCSMSQAPIFLTSDKALARAANEAGLRAFDVEVRDEREAVQRLLE
jgi:hypothetical protein